MMTSPADLETPTPPSQCALALAVPLTYQSFCFDLDAGPEKDFAHSMVSGREPECVWKIDGAPLADLCKQLLTLAASLGVKTVREAKLSDIALLFHEFPVVTIIAHWRGSEFMGEDIRVEPSIFLERIRAGTDELSHDLSVRLKAAFMNSTFKLKDSAAQRSELAELLNKEVLASEQPLPGCVVTQPGITTVVDDLWLQSVHRERLDEAFPEIFLPGNRLELRDGLHGRKAVAAMVPEGWSGVIDLVICHSAYLAQAVKDGRPERRVITNTRKIAPEVRLRIQKELYRRLASSDSNYVSILVTLFRALLDTPLQQSGPMKRLSQMLARITRL